MSQPESISQVLIPTWVDSSLFKGMLRGVEREGLRMQSNGFISQGPHPHSLGRRSLIRILPLTTLKP